MASGDFISIPIAEDEINFRRNFERGLPREGITSRRLNCTICNINIQHRLVKPRNVHTFLGVLVCNLCSHRIRSANNKEAARSKICQWCVSDNVLPGDLISCKQCPRKFCRKCIMTHSRKSKVNDWSCFVCNLSQLWPLRALCNASVAYSERLKTELEERRSQVHHSISLSRSTLRPVVRVNQRHSSPRLTAPPYSPTRMINRRITLNSSSLEGRRNSVPEQSISSIGTVTMRSEQSISSVGTTTIMRSEQSISSIGTTAIMTNTVHISSPKIENQIASNRNHSSDVEDDQSNCVICLDAKPRIACVPCGHLCLCELCLPAFQQNFTRCPMCKKVYHDSIKIYL